MAKKDIGSGAYAENARYYRDAELEDLGLKHGQGPAPGEVGHQAGAYEGGATGGTS
jgi:hypothetical protein